MSLGSYYRSVRKIVLLFNEARQKPFDNKIKWLELQEEIIVRLTAIEAAVRNAKSIIGSCTQKLRDRNACNTKEQSKALKKIIKRQEQRLETAHAMHILFRSIGDGIAFTFINKSDLKPQHFKESPGFISLKSGSRLERKIFRHIFALGEIAIMNDLTNVLKYGDITFIKAKDVWKMFEIKSGKSKDKRDRRQNERANRLLNYIHNDVPADIYDRGQVIQRVEPSLKAVNHVRKFNQTIYEARKNGIAKCELERGQVLVCCDLKYKVSIEKIIDSVNFKNPLFFSQNDIKAPALGYIPYCITFERCEDYIDFLQGKLYICQFIDITVLQKLAQRNGYNLEVDSDHEYFIHATKMNDPETKFQISNHYWGRVFFEFMSMSYIVKESIESLKKVILSSPSSP